MEELSVNKVAEMLGKTDRTIRNYIKEGRIKAKRIENQFGWEYQVYDLGEFSPAEEMQESTSPEKPETALETRSKIALQVVTQENKRLWDEYKQLREANNHLAYDLGMRDQRIKELEQALEKAEGKISGQTVVSTTDAPPPPSPASIEVSSVSIHRPWWKRFNLAETALFRRRRK